MSAYTIGSVNGVQSASRTYFQSNPTIGLAYATLVSPGGNALGYTAASNPYTSTPSASFNSGNLAATLNSDGSVTATAKCKLKIRWALTAYASANTAAVFQIVPITTSSTAPFSQLRAASITTLYTSGTPTLTTSQQSLPTIAAEFIAASGDTYVFVNSGSNTAMVKGAILEIATEPLI